MARQSEVKLSHHIIKQRRRGSSLIETVCGCIILVIVALFLVDVAAVVICQTQNDALAKHCARAAAAMDDVKNPGTAQAAADEVVAKFQAENGGSKICLVNPPVVINYQAGPATVMAVTTVTCNFPVPVPFGPSYLQFKAEAVEPIVGMALP
ncbi:MAG: hypothetical protein JSS83_03305 [Cyanobacteria bacterium SZAS LIN-3]|nr:hypothetical protein [Cyanobacteria bacterium SZAS LIN-3]